MGSGRRYSLASITFAGVMSIGAGTTLTMRIVTPGLGTSPDRAGRA
jgi:hypothetical protein